MTSDIRIETNRLILRPLGPQDEEAVIGFYMDERSSMAGYAGEYNAAAKNYYALLGHWTHRGYGLWAVTLKDQSDQAIGMVGPYFPLGRPETEVGWVLFSDDVEGKGYAAEAAQAVIEDARTRLGWSDIVHYISPENGKSVKLAEKLGAFLDSDAVQPSPDKPCLVYRQPSIQRQREMEADV